MLRLETPRAILITGPFGAGKSSLAGEIADLVEGTIPYAAIDLDWLPGSTRWTARPTTTLARSS